MNQLQALEHELMIINRREDTLNSRMRDLVDARYSYWNKVDKLLVYTVDLSPVRHLKTKIRALDEEIYWVNQKLCILFKQALGIINKIRSIQNET